MAQRRAACTGTLQLYHILFILPNNDCRAYGTNLLTSCRMMKCYMLCKVPSHSSSGKVCQACQLSLVPCLRIADFDDVAFGRSHYCSVWCCPRFNRLRERSCIWLAFCTSKLDTVSSTICRCVITPNLHKLVCNFVACRLDNDDCFD